MPSPIDQGLDFEREGRFEEALIVFERAIAAGREPVRAWYSKGWTLERMGKRDDAERCYRKALELKPSYVPALGSLGLLLMDDNPDEASRYFDRGLELEPDNWRTLANRGALRHRRGQLQSALLDLRQAMQVAPDDVPPPERSRVWTLICQATASLGDLEEADHCADIALELDERNMEAWNYKGWVLDRMGRSEEALLYFQEILADEPDNVEVRRNLGCALLRLGNAASAITQLKIVAEARPNAYESFYNLACAYARADRSKDAISMLHRAVALSQKARTEAIQDPDLAPLRGEPGFKALLS